MRYFIWLFMLGLMPLSSVSAQQDKIQQLEERIKKLEEQMTEQKKILDETKQELQKEMERKAPPPQTPSGPSGAPSLRLIDMSLDILGSGGGSTARELELRSLEGGGHDPKNRGFTIQNVELTLSGVVDPYFRGDAHIVSQIDETGETIVELEEAYLTSLDLPYNLQLKAGQFFNAFGRLNSMHPHAWDFVNQPVVNSRFMGPDGFRNPGVQVSWLTPLPFFAELTGSVQNAHGETAPSFRGVPDEFVAGRMLTDRDVRALKDLVYLVRLNTSFDLTEEITLVPGTSALFGPNATGRNTETQIYGADLYVKWKPLTHDKGWPFLAWQTEVMARRYEAASVEDAGVEVAGREILDDWGLYSQIIWGFARPWTLGFRYDYAQGEDEAFDVGGVTYSSSTDPFRDLRRRESLALTYFPSEFSKLRLQYAYDRADFLRDEDAHSIYLQFEIMFGAHGAHKF